MNIGRMKECIERFYWLDLPFHFSPILVAAKICQDDLCEKLTHHFFPKILGMLPTLATYSPRNPPFLVTPTSQLQHHVNGGARSNVVRFQRFVVGQLFP